jgi:hypothetical protein
MSFTLRAVVAEDRGNVGVVIERWTLKATRLVEAKSEVDRGNWPTEGLKPNVLEIIDDTGTVVARRGYLGKNVYAPWVAPPEAAS